MTFSLSRSLQVFGFALLISACAAAKAASATLTQNVAYPAASLSCRATIQVVVNQDGTGNPVNPSCTLQPSPIPPSQRFVASYISYVTTAWPSCDLAYMASQDASGAYDFLAVNPPTLDKVFSGGGVYPVVWEAGQAPTVSAFFTCHAGGSVTAFVLFTVRGHFEPI